VLPGKAAHGESAVYQLTSKHRHFASYCPVAAAFEAATDQSTAKYSQFL